MQGCASLAVVLTGAQVCSPSITGSRNSWATPTAPNPQNMSGNWDEDIRRACGVDMGPKVNLPLPLSFPKIGAMTSPNSLLTWQIRAHLNLDDGSQDTSTRLWHNSCFTPGER